jgi:copper chaperone
MSNVSQNLDTRDYTVVGMTCAHCVISVREEVSQIPGVIAVDVDLASGRMSVSADDLGDDAIRAAVEEAGYELAS